MAFKRRTRGKKLNLALIGTLLAVFVFTAPATALQTPQVPLAGSKVPQFAQPLPLLTAAGGTMQTVDGTEAVNLRMCEFKAEVLPPNVVLPGGAYTGTWVWGYLPDPDGDSTCAALVDQYKKENGLIDTYIGPVVLAERGTPTTMSVVNDLGSADTTNVLAYKYSSDLTLHWADPLNGGANMSAHMAMAPGFNTPGAQNYSGPVPAAVHLHGGEVPPEIDGGPDSWFTSNGLHGPDYYSAPGAPTNGIIYNYPNKQEAAPIWFHDHTLGATRLNVYAGLAGGYLIADPNLTLPAGLSAYGLSRNGATGAAEVTVPLVLQDRTFDTNGQFFMPADSAGGVQWAPNPEHPYWVPEFVGDTVVVNGKAWPFFNVEPKRYRFLLINGSNARTYEMFLVNPATKVMGPSMYAIATDGGYLDGPVKIDPNAPKGQMQRLTMMPGERYEVIIDFAGLPNGTRLVLKNVGKTPFPAGTAPQGTTVGQIMQFQVTACASGKCGTQDTSYNPATGVAIRSGSQQIVRLANPTTGALAAGVTVAKTRSLTLNEVMGMAQKAINPVTGLMTAYPGGPLEILLNNTKWDGTRATGVDPTNMYVTEQVPGTQLFGTNYLSELPQEGDTEIWEIVNTTADAHPIHLHLVQFQLMNRQGFNKSNYAAAYAMAFQGGGYNPMTKLPYPAGTYIPAFGPPLPYGPSLASGNKYGGNPDVTPFLQGAVKAPNPNEAGWKDTIIAYPGEVTRIAVRWAPTDLPVNTLPTSLYFPFDPYAGGQFGYVWHCHIIDHEDNEMMRPDNVQLNPVAPAPIDRPLVKGEHY